MENRFNLLLCLMLLVAAGFAPAATAATFTVDVLFDDLDADDATPGDGICADSFGSCPLRAAIQEANALVVPGIDTIEFSVDGTILISAAQGALPTITDGVTIDGSTAPGYPGFNENLEDAPPSIYIDGSALGGSGGSARGLRFVGSASSFSAVRAMGIVNFKYGISMSSNSGSNLVDACYIGVLADGTAAGNETGINIATDDNIIGRLLDNPGNVISANVNFGIFIGIASGNLVGGNRIGTTPNGVSARGNGTGISGVADGNRIGLFNATVDYGNLISGNITNGILLLGSDNDISANVIGISRNGAPLANGGIGIRVQGSNNTIGSTATNGANDVANNVDGIVITSGDGNVITGNRVGTLAFSQGNSGDGIRIDGGANDIIGNRVLNNGNHGIITLGDGTTIEDNQVGWVYFVAGGIQDFGSGGDGIRVESASNNVIGNSVGFGSDGIDVRGPDNWINGNYIGVTTEGDSIANAGDGISIHTASGNLLTGNSIAFNGFAGVYMPSTAGTGTAIYDNSMFSNNILGIDLLGDGPTPNDPGDPDTGPNNLQNFPEILSVVFDGAVSPPELTVQWRIDSAVANSSYSITADFYLADSAVNGEGKTYLGLANASAPNVIRTTVLTLPVATAGGYLVATATDGNGSGSTSEFSASVEFGISDTIFKNGFDAP